MTSNEHFVNFPLAGISLLLKGSKRKRCFSPSNLADTSKTELGNRLRSERDVTSRESVGNA